MNSISPADPMEAKSGLNPPYVLRPVDGASFLLLGDQSAVFSEASQKIYALNHIAAYIWCQLEEGETLHGIRDGLVRSGVAANLADKYVSQAMRMWHKVGLLRPDWQFDHEVIPFVRSFNIHIAGFTATMRIATERLADLLTLFDHQSVPMQDGRHIIDVVEADNFIQVFHNNHGAFCCDPNELAPTLKAYITDQLVAASPPNVVVHAACLRRGGKNLLISGRPGAGKTTLSLRLAEAGFTYGGDDITLVAPDGTAAGVPFAPAIKPGAWEIVSQFRPDLDEAVIHRRPDGKRVRYVRPERIDGSYGPVGWILFIRRGRGPAKFTQLDRIEVMRRLMDGSYSPGEKMTLAMCNALKQAINGADCFELSYSDSAEARDAIIRLCDG
ncbi:hypothetical protein [Bradyrhizobium sp. SYSU BS000235]|uniref:hypothetical protein n=1 Tax=Bradyrhizobium sp. SYSU BS000235 TaxID=3411332 RepID=UPI003C729F49